MSNDKKIVRKHVRNLRQKISQNKQQLASLHLCSNISTHKAFLNAKNIAFYFASDGEINLKNLIFLAESKHKSCFLPCIEKPYNTKTKSSENHTMIFRYFKNSRKSNNRKKILTKNLFGIDQPNKRQAKKSANRLDLIFLPLVAFDNNGNRLGMGGGFYDQCFSFKNKGVNKSRNISKPLLIGCAHSAQEVDSLKPEEWDIPLDGILTEKYFLQF